MDDLGGVADLIPRCNGYDARDPCSDPQLENVAKRSEGRRLFAGEFERAQIDRILKGEFTASELSREHGVARSLPW